MDDFPEADPKEEQLLQLAIEYVTTGAYPPGITKVRKRAVRRKAGTLVIDKGEVFVWHHRRKVKVVMEKEEQARILRACHAEPTSGHFGVTKTWRRAAERFYWQGMSLDVKKLVSTLALKNLCVEK